MHWNTLLDHDDPPETGCGDYDDIPIFTDQVNWGKESDIPRENFDIEDGCQNFGRNIGSVKD